MALEQLTLVFSKPRIRGEGAKGRPISITGELLFESPIQKWRSGDSYPSGAEQTYIILQRDKQRVIMITSEYYAHGFFKLKVGEKKYDTISIFDADNGDNALFEIKNKIYSIYDNAPIVADVNYEVVKTIIMEAFGMEETIEL